MLREISKTRQVKGEMTRRWFTSDYFDLFVRYNADNQIAGFDLCYDKHVNERVLVCRDDGSLHHHRVDDGESNLYSKMTPVYLPDGQFEIDTVKVRLLREAADIDPEVLDYILLKLTEMESVD